MKDRFRLELVVEVLWALEVPGRRRNLGYWRALGRGRWQLARWWTRRTHGWRLPVSGRHHNRARSLAFGGDGRYRNRVRRRRNAHQRRFGIPGYVGAASPAVCVAFLLACR